MPGEGVAGEGEPLERAASRATGSGARAGRRAAPPRRRTTAARLDAPSDESASLQGRSSALSRTIARSSQYPSTQAGSARNRPTTTVHQASAGQRQRPSGTGRRLRAAPGRRPVEPPRARIRASTVRATAVRPTSTSASTAAGVRSKSAPVLEVDRTCERVVPHQRDDAEVRERVERDEQRAERDGRADRRQRDPEEHACARGAEAAGGLLERGVELPQRRRREQEHVRVRGQRERDAERPSSPSGRAAARRRGPAAAGPSRRRSRAGRARRRSSGSRAAARRRRPTRGGPAGRCGRRARRAGRATSERRRDHPDDEQDRVGRRAAACPGPSSRSSARPPPLATRITR